MTTNLRKHTILLVALGILAFSSLFLVYRVVRVDALSPAPPPALRIMPSVGNHSHADFVPGRVLVRYQEGVKADVMNDVLAEEGLTLLYQIDRLDVQVMAVAPGEELRVVQRLQADPRVLYAEPDYILYAHTTTPNDPYYAPYQWDMRKINADDAWDATTGSSSVTVAVLDTGVDLSHPDLAANIIAGYDFINNDPSPEDDQGHGTHVAGIIGAVGNNNTGIAGMVWRTKLMPLKVLSSNGSGSTSGIADAIIWATDHGADIINLSLGGPSPSSALENSVNYAYNAGVLVIASAGNDYQNGNPVFYPAAYNHVLGVAATGDQDEHAAYSETGYFVDVAAPGGNPTSEYDTNPDHWITSTYWRGSGHAYAQIVGTSQAAPHVSGLAALLLSINSSLTNDQLQQIIEDTAVDLGAAGRDDFFGHGRIDAAAAIAAARPATATPTATATVFPTSTPSPTRTPNPTATATVTPTPVPSSTPQPPSINEPVNDNTTPAPERLPAIAVMPSGKAVAVWTDARNGLEDIYAAEMPALPHKWGANVKASDGPSWSIQKAPAVAVSHSGRAVVLWVDSRDGNQDIYWADKAPGASEWTPRGRVNDVSTNKQIAPDIVMDGAGAAYAVWEDYRNDAGNPDIYYAYLAPNGTRWSASQRVNDAMNARQTHPALTIDQQNVLHVVWDDSRDGLPNIYWAHKPASSGAWSSARRVNDVTTGRQLEPDIATDGKGVIHAIWQDFRHGLSDPDIYAAKLTPPATSWGQSRRVNDDRGVAEQAHPTIAGAPLGSVYAAWEDDRAGDLDIYFSQLRVGASTWTPNRLVNDDAGAAEQTDPALAVDAAGNAYLVWRDARNASGATDINTDIYSMFLANPESLRLFLPMISKTF